VIRYGFYSLPRSIGKPLLAGFLIAGLITAVIPDDFFTGALGTGIWGMLAMLVVGIPVYVCSTASVPIAAALMAKGISPGAALVFLMTGPATNAAALAMVLRVMGKRTTAIFLGTTALSALASGLLLDYIWSQGTLMGIHMDSEVHGMMSTTMKGAAALVLIAVLSLAFFGACGKPKAAKTEESPAKTGTTESRPEIKETMTVNLSVEGMTCTNCENKVTKALESCQGVASAKVDHKTGKAVVKGDQIDKEALKVAVAKRGYVVEIVE
jgi:copper chaperone CopZ